MRDPAVRLQWWQTHRFVVAVALASIIPLLWPTIPPLVDLPGHMGRYRVQLDISDTPLLARWYDFHWQLIGNLGVDLLIEPLAPILGLEPAVKLIVMAIPALTVTGLLWIAHEVHGRVPSPALFALPLAYSYPFQFGFVNFALSMALALNLFALWLRMARMGRLRMRAIVFVPLSCALWVCHTFGWGVMGVLAFSAEMIRQHDLHRGRGPTGWIKAWIIGGLGCLPLALPILLMIFWRSGDHVAGQTGDWFNWRAKLMWLLMVLRDRWMAFDITSTTVLLLILFKGLRDARIEYSRNLGLSALFLLAVFIVLPRIVFGSAYADMRLAPFMLAIAIIALRPRPGMSIRGASTLAVIGVTFFLIRLGGTTVSLWLFDRSYAHELAALPHVPRSARMVSFVGEDCQNDWTMTRLEHLPAIALERRLAFSNDQWSMPGAQLLTTHYPAPGYSHDPSQIVTARPCSHEWWRTIATSLADFPRDRYDYLWLIRVPRYDPGLEAGLIPLWRSGNSALFRIDHAGARPTRIDSRQ